MKRIMLLGGILLSLNLSAKTTNPSGFETSKSSVFVKCGSWSEVYDVPGHSIGKIRECTNFWTGQKYTEVRIYH
jgi:hypothetical protein